MEAARNINNIFGQGTVFEYSAKREAAEKLNHSVMIHHLKQIGKLRKLDKHKLTEKYKIIAIKVLSSLILHNNNNKPFV